jgi:cytochrome c553
MTRSIATRGRVVRYLLSVLPLKRYAFRASELVVMLSAVLTASAAPAPDFSREVRPLLEQHCFKCHGPEKQKGGLRFDTKEGGFKTGESFEEERIRTRFNELDDMIATTGSAMLGLTLGCARCHDHKYDPVPRRDYYRVLSAFNGGDGRKCRSRRSKKPGVSARRKRNGRGNSTRPRSSWTTG